MLNEFNKMLRDQYKEEEKKDCNDGGEYDLPTWEYVFWLEERFIASSQIIGGMKNE